MGLFGPPDVVKLEATRDVPGLIKALAYERDAVVRLDAASALGRLNHVASVGPLVSALSDPDEEVREAAVRALGALGGAQSVSPLCACLRDGEKRVREAAAEALVKIGGPAIERLANTLRGPNQSAREMAASALAQIGAPARPALLAAMNDGSAEVRAAASAGLASSGWTPGGETERAPQVVDARVYEAPADAPGTIGYRRAVKRLIAALKGPSPQGRLGAVEALCQIGDPIALKPIAALLRDPYSNVREAAERALVELSDAADAPTRQAAISVLTPLLRGQFAVVRDSAVRVLGKVSGADGLAARHEWDKCVEIGEPAVLSLIAALADPSDGVRQAAADALGRIGRAATEALCLNLGDQDPHVRWRAADALGKIRDYRSVRPLLIARGDPDPYVRQAAATALGTIGTRTLSQEELFEALADGEPAVRASAAATLAGIGAPGVSRRLVALLKSRNMDTRLAAAEALAQMGDVRPLLRVAEALRRIDSPFIGTLLAAVEGQDEDGRKKTAEVLVQVGTPAIEPLLVALSDPGEHVRTAAATALGRIRASRAIAPLSSTLAHDLFWPVRAAAAEALGKIGDYHAFGALGTALGDRDSTVCAAAYEALKVNGWFRHKVVTVGDKEILQTTRDHINYFCYHHRWLEIEGGKRFGTALVREELELGNSFHGPNPKYPWTVVKEDCRCGYRGFTLT